jgi:hypothetical protein
VPISATFFHAEEVLEVTAHANGVIIMERSTDSRILFCSVDVYLSEFSTHGDSPNPVSSQPENGPNFPATELSPVT